MAYPRTLDYLSGDHELESIEAWKRSARMRPDILIIAPSVRDVGEQQLIQELARASYELRGLRDSHSRHFISRSFPLHADDRRYARFADEPFDAAEITNGFYGVDNIDLSDWAGVDPSMHSSTWRLLTDHVLDHPETDFVFTLFTDDPADADPIIRSIRESCGVAVEVVELDYPDEEMLVRAFDERSGHRFADHLEYAAERIHEMCAESKRMNYSFIGSCALSAIHELSIAGDERTALERVMDRFASLTPQQSRTFVIGF